MNKFNYYLYFSITVINKILLTITNGNFQLNNPYDTEKQEYYFTKIYKNDFLNYDKSVIEVEREIDLKKFYKKSIGMRGFQFISNLKLANKLIKQVEIIEREK